METLPVYRTPIVKSQTVRVIDVTLLGPFMVWVGARRSNLPGWARITMVGFGVATVVYNARNYVRVRAHRRSLLS